MDDNIRNDIAEDPQEETPVSAERQPLSEESCVQSEPCEEVVTDDSETVTQEEITGEETETICGEDESECECISEEDAECEEESEEGIPEDELCLHCGEKRRKDPESDYCGTCEKILKKTKIPFVAWLAGLFSILFSLVCLVFAGLISAPALQILQGDIEAEKNNWYGAYTEYTGADSVISEITGIIGTDVPFVKTGCRAKLKIFKAIAKYQSPLDAAGQIDSIFGAQANTYAAKKGIVKKYKAVFDEYQATYEALGDGIAMIEDPEYDFKEVKAKFDAVRGTEGVSDVFVDYFVCSLAEYSAITGDELLGYYDQLDKSAKDSKNDYSWLYYTSYAQVLIEAEKYKEADKLLEELQKQDVGNYNAALLRIRCAVKQGNVDGAESIVDAYQKENGTQDTTYILQVYLERIKGNYDAAKAILEEALQEYTTTPELKRQEALIYLIEGDYDNAFESAFAADDIAYCLYYYYGDSSSYTNELMATVYLATYLEKEKGSGETESAQYIDEILKSFEGQATWQKVLDIIDGKLTIKEALTEGTCDLI